MSHNVFGLIGHPLGHSISPKIQSHFGIKNYELFDVLPNELQSFLTERQFDGVNVTIPFKKAVVPYLDELDDTASATGSVNVILNDGQKLVGYNTDCFGFHYLLKASDIRAYHKKCTIIGTGGVSASIEKVLYDEGAESVRFITHAQADAGDFSAFQSTDILINATPAGMYPDTDNKPLSLDSFPWIEAYIDVIANPYRTRLLQQAEARKLPCAGGLPMLIGQAAKSAELFSNSAVSSYKIDEALERFSKEILNIILIGMPGSGKSTVGKILAEATCRDFYDTDKIIEESTGRKISEIINTDGEAAFRKMEAETIKDLGSKTGLVIATGGGCVTTRSNLPFLRQNGYCVYLNVPLNDLDVKDRPLSSDKYALLRMFNQRHPIYASLSDVTIQRRDTPQETAEAIKNAFRKMQPWSGIK